MSGRLEALEADISTLALDAIVNAANEPLIMGGGVDGAIRRKAGREMEEEIRRVGRCPTGSAVITKGHRLPARFVIHTVAPVWGGGGATEQRKKELLSLCYRNALLRADENAIASIAFPCIGTGIYGWPAELAAEIAFDAVVDHLRSCAQQTRIVFCCFSRPRALRCPDCARRLTKPAARKLDRPARGRHRRPAFARLWDRCSKTRQDRFHARRHSALRRPPSRPGSRSPRPSARHPRNRA